MIKNDPSIVERPIEARGGGRLSLSKEEQENQHLQQLVRDCFAPLARWHILAPDTSEVLCDDLVVDDVSYRSPTAPQQSLRVQDVGLVEQKSSTYRT